MAVKGLVALHSLCSSKAALLLTLSVLDILRDLCSVSEISVLYVTYICNVGV